MTSHRCGWTVVGRSPTRRRPGGQAGAAGKAKQQGAPLLSLTAPWGFRVENILLRSSVFCCLPYQKSVVQRCGVRLGGLIAANEVEDVRFYFCQRVEHQLIAKSLSVCPPLLHDKGPLAELVTGFLPGDRRKGCLTYAYVDNPGVMTTDLMETQPRMEAATSLDGMGMKTSQGSTAVLGAVVDGFRFETRLSTKCF